MKVWRQIRSSWYCNQCIWALGYSRLVSGFWVIGIPLLASLCVCVCVFIEILIIRELWDQKRNETLLKYACFRLGC